MNTSRRDFVSMSLVAIATPSLALAGPSSGKNLPDATVETVDGKKLSLSSLEGKTIVIVYEDKDSAKVNEAFKKDLSKVTQSSMVPVPIADVSEYNSWPAKGFVKDAIREESKKAGTTIYCDWDASFRKALELTKGTSCVVVASKKGKVLFAHDGSLSEEQRKLAIAAIIDDA